jgi:hypothetical protein
VPAALYPQKYFLVLISVRGRVNFWAVVRLEGLGALKGNHPNGTRTSDLTTCRHSASTKYATACACAVNTDVDKANCSVMGIVECKLVTAFDIKYQLIPLNDLKNIIYVRFEVFTAVTMKNGVFGVVTPCGSCKNRRFGGTWRLFHQGDKNLCTRNNTSCN